MIWSFDGDIATAIDNGDDNQIPGIIFGTVTTFEMTERDAWRGVAEGLDRQLAASCTWRQVAASSSS